MAKILFYLYFSRVSRAIFEAPKRPGKDRHSTLISPPDGARERPLTRFLRRWLHQWRQAHFSAPFSEVRDTPQHTLTRTSEQRGTTTL